MWSYDLGFTAIIDIWIQLWLKKEPNTSQRRFQIIRYNHFECFLCFGKRWGAPNSYRNSTEMRLVHTGGKAEGLCWHPGWPHGCSYRAFQPKLLQSAPSTSGAGNLGHFPLFMHHTVRTWRNHQDNVVAQQGKMPPSSPKNHYITQSPSLDDFKTTFLSSQDWSQSWPKFEWEAGAATNLNHLQTVSIVCFTDFYKKKTKRSLPRTSIRLLSICLLVKEILQSKAGNSALFSSFWS